LTVTATAAFVLKINFQPSSSPVPAGYLVDGGAVFGSRGNGYSYGWNIDNTSFVRDRNSSRSPDQRYDTLNHLQKAGGARTWEITVPNGTYNVFAVAGDPDYIDSVFRLNVEGVLTVSGTPTSATHWFSGSNSVTVSDGRLTVSNGTGGSNNKICFIEISSASGGTFAAAASSEGPITLRLIQRDVNGRITLQPEGSAGGICVIEASEDLKTWQPVATTNNLSGPISFDDPASAGRPQRFYRAVPVR